MSRSLIKSIQNDPDIGLRLILPFGLNLRLGDVVSVGKDGNFTLEGNCVSLLREPRGAPRPAVSGKPNMMKQFGKDTEWKFRLAGTASSLFPETPKTSAGIDISFGSADAWVLAVAERSLTTLDNLHRFREPILWAYDRGVWGPDWAVVTCVAAVKRMTLLASRNPNTKIALTLSGNVSASEAAEAKFTAGVSIAAVSQQIFQCIMPEPMTAFCSAMLVRHPWWSVFPKVAHLAAPGGRKTIEDVRQATDEQFWENVTI